MKPIRVDCTQLSLFQISDTIFHIYEDSKVKVGVCGQDSLAGASLVSCADGSWLFYCTSETGTLYRVSQRTVEGYLARQEKDSPDDDIFSDLLEASGDADNRVPRSSKTVYNLKEKDKVLQLKEHVTSLSVSCGFVTITTSVDDGFKTLVYREKDLVEGKVEPVQSLHLPCLLRKKLLGKATRKDVHKMEEKEARFVPNSTCLVYFMVSDLINCEGKCSSNSIRVSSDLFKHLFGQDVALLNSPVLLICPPEGSVYFSPLRTIQGMSDTYPSCSISNTSKSRSGWKIFCETLDRVVAISPIQLESDTNTSGGVEPMEVDDSSSSLLNGMVVCSKNGLLHVVTESKNLRTVPKFVSEIANCGMTDAGVHGTSLFCSTGSDITKHKLVLKDGPSESVEPLLQLKNEEHLNLADVSAFTVIQDLQCGTRCVLLCQLWGEEIKVLNPENEKNKRSWEPSLNPGQEIKELLLCLEQTDRRRKELNEIFKKQDYWMQQVNLAAVLRGLFDADGRKKNHPFHCTVKARSVDLPTHSEVVVDCIVTNQSSQTLSCDWSISASLQQTNEESLPDHVTTCLKLPQGLETKESVKLSVPIDLKDIMKLMCLKIFFTLQIDEKYANGKPDILTKAKSTSEKVGVAIPGFKQNLDLFYFVQDESQIPRYKNLPNHGPSSTESVIRQIAMSKPAARFFPDLVQNMEKGLATQMSSRNVCVPVRFIVDKEKVKNKSLAKEVTSDPRALLKYVLKDSSVGDSCVKGNQCCLVTMLGQKVFLSVQWNVGQGETTPSELLIRSDLATVAVMHDAITRRLGCLEDAGVSKPTLTLKGVHKAMDSVEEIEMDLNTLNEVNSGNKHLPESDVYELICNIYTKLRQVSL